MISIVVPVYNSEKWIKRCVDSLINQSFSDIEILLINDGSADGSLEIMREYEKKDSRVRVFDKKNEGVSRTRNLGIREARGQYIQFVDSDDYLEPDTCEKLYNLIEGCDLAMCGMRIWQNGKVLREPHAKQGVYKLKDSVDVYFDLRKVNLGPCNKLYKKEKILSPFKEGLSLGEDTLFVIDYMRNIDIVAVTSEPLYNVVLDNNNSLNKKKYDNKLDMLIEQRIYEEELLKFLYGEKCDLTECCNQYFKNFHAHFLGSDGYTSKDIKKYTDSGLLKEKIRKSKMGRMDYTVLKYLFLTKQNKLIKVYFEIKKKLYSR